MFFDWCMPEMYMQLLESATPATAEDLRSSLFCCNTAVLGCHQFVINYGWVRVIVVGNGHGDTSSNPGRDGLHFT